MIHYKEFTNLFKKLNLNNLLFFRCIIILRVLKIGDNKNRRNYIQKVYSYNPEIVSWIVFIFVSNM